MKSYKTKASALRALKSIGEFSAMFREKFISEVDGAWNLDDDAAKDAIANFNHPVHDADQNRPDADAIAEADAIMAEVDEVKAAEAAIDENVEKEPEALTVDEVGYKDEGEEDQRNVDADKSKEEMELDEALENGDITQEQHDAALAILFGKKGDAVANDQQTADGKGTAKVIKRQSEIVKPCVAVWNKADEMIGASRKDIIQACVDAGIAFYTARTQYQQWFTINRERVNQALAEKKATDELLKVADRRSEARAE